MISKGFVGLFSTPLGKEQVTEIVSEWIARFEALEQVIPNQGHDIAALRLKSAADVMWEANLQFRILNGEDFAWAYITMERQVIETTGLPNENISLCLDALLELPHLAEIIDQHNERRLDELEANGLM